jgi:hypothetical protein
MTYNEKLRKVMAKLDSDAADSEVEWAANILKAIGITPENPDGAMNAGLPDTTKLESAIQTTPSLKRQ